MKNGHLKFAFLIMLLGTVMVTSVHAQGWERIYQGSTGGPIDFYNSYANIIFLQEDGSYMFASEIIGESKFIWTDENGYITDIMNAPTSGGHLMETSDGNYLMAGRLSGTAPPEEDVFVRKFDPAGNTIWNHTFGNVFANETVLGLHEDADGNYIFCGVSATGSPSNPDLDVYVTKTNDAGDVIWKALAPLTEYLYQFYFTVTADGGFLMAGSSSYISPGNPLVSNVIKFTAEGTWAWSKTLETGMKIEDVITTPDGGFALIGNDNAYDFVLLKLDDQGNESWSQTYTGEEGYAKASTIINTIDGGFAFVGNSLSIDNGDILMVKTDAGGNSEWSRTFGGAYEDNVNDLKQTPDGGYVIAGGANGVGEDQSVYLIKTDETGNSIANKIYGNVLYDLNENCLNETEEQALEDWVVSASGDWGTFYAAVNENGYYAIEVSAGDHEVSLTLPNEYWMTCDNDVEVTVIDSFNVEFPVQSVEQCPLMVVELQNFGFRLCETSTVNVLCSNMGTMEAEGVYVEITFDDSLQIVSSSIPYTLVDGNTYSFDIGAIDFLESYLFQVDVKVGCDIELMGQALCAEAHIFPDETCLPVDPLWSGASISLSASCEDDQVVFEIKNVGEGDMILPLEYIVIQDDVIMMQAEPYGPLMAGQSITVEREANGSFYRLESPQVAYHPEMSMPSAFMEGCGVNEDGEVSTGYVNQFILDDAEYYLDMSCSEVLAAYDPNIKEAFPRGYQDEHYIAKNTELDYVIRFQNTGTATANEVVLVDVLSEHLDPATIRPGVSSHEYDFEIYGNGIVKFTFEDIQLPDSTANEPESHGFVQFSIQQRSDLPLGTVIENSADIYFDFNPPITTNQTYHTIGENFITVDVDEVFDEKVTLKVYPNPFSESATIELNGNREEEYSISIYDGIGKLVVTDSFEGNRYVIKKGNIPSGIFFYEIQNKNGSVNSGKLIVK